MSDCFKVDSTVPGYVKVSGRSIPVSELQCSPGDFASFSMTDRKNRVSVGGVSYKAAWLSETEVVASWSPTTGSITLSKMILSNGVWSKSKTVTISVSTDSMDYSITVNSQYIILCAIVKDPSDDTGRLFVYLIDKSTLSTVKSYTSIRYRNHFYNNWVTCSMYSDNILLVSYPIYFTNFLDSFDISGGNISLKSHISALNSSMYGCGVGKAKDGLVVVLGTDGTGSTSPLIGSFFTINSAGVVTQTPVYSKKRILNSDGSGYTKKYVKYVGNSIFYTFSDYSSNSLEVAKVDCSGSPVSTAFSVQGVGGSGSISCMMEEGDTFFSLATYLGTFLFAIGNDGISLVKAENGNLLFSKGQFLDSYLYSRDVIAVKAFSSVSGIAIGGSVPSVTIP